MSLKVSDQNIVRIASTLFVLATILMTIVLMVSKYYHIPIKKITGDPLVTYKANPFTGLISNIGVLVWCATTSVCWFSALVLWNRNKKKEGIFLLCSGLLTSLLLIDDFFMIHDYIFYSVGLNKYPMYTLYLITTVSYLLYFKSRIQTSKNLFFLLLAFVFLGSSLVMDILINEEGLAYFFEDSFKFFGIISWFLFYTTTSFLEISATDT